MSSSGESGTRDLWARWKLKEDNFARYRPIRSTLIYGTPSETVPSVSVIVPAYMKAEGLKNALDSAIRQDYDLPYEIIVVDDSGFDPQIDELMKEYCRANPNMLYYRNDENLGVFGNWNRACELCRSEWYCLLHDDDKMKPYYLKTCMSLAGSLSDKVGLIGNYMETVDSNTGEVRKTLIDKIVAVFIKLRNKKPIYLTLKDNIKHVFVQPCCLFINKKKAVELGGLDDEYYPSSDFVLAAKMNYYYSSVFLPVILTERGVGNNNSLKQSVCDGAIGAAYNLSLELAKETGLSSRSQKRKASIAAVISEIGVRGYNATDYSGVKASLGMKKIYNNGFIISLINVYSKLYWGLLLFRMTSLKGPGYE